MRDEALGKAVQAAGSVSGLARAIGVAPQAVSQWARVPIARAADVERVTGVARHELRPDVWDAPRPSETTRRALEPGLRGDGSLDPAYGRAEVA